ncbi:hypothetical protein KFK09_024012 [Dendrobium nobile]|uniref:Uncharacterized protein n=1 Tax=Dendrobium nobile TaxID=94219 RepID=A0A8T3ABG8_DENNO|nr:hypothetical protein KFK09_024012 [Dendrobium nobile]
MLKVVSLGKRGLYEAHKRPTNSNLINQEERAEQSSSLVERCLSNRSPSTIGKGAGHHG